MGVVDIEPGSLVLSPSGKYVQVWTVRWLHHGRVRLIGSSNSWYVNRNQEVKVK